MCSSADDPTMHDAEDTARAWIANLRGKTEGEIANPGWAYRDANGKLLRGPCHDPVCAYASDPGGEPHAGKHSWQDGTTGYPHDFGSPCDCPDCEGEDR